METLKERRWLELQVLAALVSAGTLLQPFVVQWVAGGPGLCWWPQTALPHGG